MMHKSKNKFKNFNKMCCLLTDEGLAVALSDQTESSLTNNASSACSSGNVDEATLILQFDIVKIKTSLVRQDFR